MKKLTMQNLREYGPCYDPLKYLPKNFKGTILDILDHKEIPFQDKLWVILRTELVSEKLMRLFAVWSYRQTLLFIKNPDPRSIECVNVAEKYANGEASLKELSAARSAAWSATRSAARSAAESAARSAAWSATRSAARSAAWSATRSAARSAAESAAWSAESAAESAAWSAARSAESAARSAAWSATRSAARSAAKSAAESIQENKLREMIIAGIKTGDTK